MNKFNFTEMICALQLTKLKAQREKNDKLLDKDFWYVVDHLDNETLFTWGERMIKNKQLLQGANYVKIVGILHDYRQIHNYSRKQKRALSMMLINYWDEVSLDYLY